MSEQENTGRAVSERIIRQLRETMTIDRVYGTPIERAGTTVVPVASVRIGGGGGGGVGTDGNDSGSGEGGGFGAVARPAGAFIIREGSVRWKPVLDVNRLVLALNLTAVAYFFFAWRVERAKARRR